jgi:hypothetical protein
MSCRVVLRNRKVLLYNDAMRMDVHDGTVCLYPKEKESIVCRIPLDVVERVEWYRPCRITKERELRKLRTD